MGSSPSAPTVVLPTATAPTMYQSTVPLESYEDVAESIERSKKELAKVQAERYRETGTPAEIGARQAGLRMQEAASYLSTVPTADKALQLITGEANPYKAAREAAEQNLTEAQKQYAKALLNIGETPTPTPYEKPSWAKRTVTETKTPV